jgi:hypothetical protein
VRRIGNGYPHWPPRSLSCSGADRPEAACGLDSADPAASLKGPGAVATVSSPLAIEALGRMSDTRDRQRLNQGGELLEDGAEAYGADMQEGFAASRRVVLRAHRAVTGPVVLAAFRAAVVRRGVV